MTADSSPDGADTPEAGGGPQRQEVVASGDDHMLDSGILQRTMTSSPTNRPVDQNADDSLRLAPAGPEPEEDEGSEDTEDGVEDWGDSFEDKCFVWCEILQEHIKEMREALMQEPSEQELEELVVKNLEHYQLYYRIKKEAASEDVVKVMLGRWRSPLEAVFLWIGGWRPSMVFSLAYSKASQDSEEAQHPFLAGIDSTPITNLSSEQLQAISDKQEEVKKEEDFLSEKLAMLQLALADEPILTLAEKDQHQNHHINIDDNEDGETGDIETLEAALNSKLKDLAEILVEADKLRLSTLTEVVTLLNPLQATQYLLAAADLAEAIRKIGKMKMSGTNHNGEDEETGI